jgi:predicted transglutaminase-like cysteine proteinase
LPGVQTRFPFIAIALLLLTVAVCFTGNDPIFSKEFLNRIRDRYGDRTMTRVMEWEKLMRIFSDQTERIKLERVNEFFNRMANVADSANWGQRDYWATPVELLAVAGGDCEDFAIAKYFSLKMMAVPEDRLRLTYVRAYAGGTSLTIVPHLVLVYYPDPEAEPLVLDNLIPEIKPASARSDLVPTYSFNANGLWQARERNRGVRIGGPDHIYKWQDLLKRMQE